MITYTHTAHGTSGRIHSAIDPYPCHFRCGGRVDEPGHACASCVGEIGLVHVAIAEHIHRGSR